MLIGSFCCDLENTLKCYSPSIEILPFTFSRGEDGDGDSVDAAAAAVDMEKRADPRNRIGGGKAAPIAARGKQRQQVRLIASNINLSQACKL